MHLRKIVKDHSRSFVKIFHEVLSTLLLCFTALFPQGIQEGFVTFLQFSSLIHFSHSSNRQQFSLWTLWMSWQTDAEVSIPCCWNDCRREGCLTLENYQDWKQTQKLIALKCHETSDVSLGTVPHLGFSCLSAMLAFHRMLLRKIQLVL